MLPKKNRLKKRKEFQLVFERGKFFESNFLKIKLKPDFEQGKKVAVVAPVKVFRKAVERNKIKRKLREAVRPLLKEIPEKTAFILIAKKELSDKSVEQIKKDIKEFLIIKK